MDTTRIKRFATEARNILKAGIAAKITSLGFDREGNVPENLRPTLMQGGSLWNGQLQTEGFYHQWMSLYQRIQQIGIKDVYEEAAYTWFNRLCAIRILQKNDLCQPVLAYADAARTPIIVDEARQGHLPPMKEEERVRLMELLDDDTKVTEQFAVLITAWCHYNPIIDRCFGAIADYTALLLPNNILAEGGFVDLLNHTEFITDDDFRSPELIGWLYQFYISERKDEVFAKKGKFEADEIPAATQIFTPNWIVKYMVQNTVGRIYLDNNPYETQLQKKWQYLVEPAEKLAPESTLHYDELTDLRVADLACGSGHILNECFDLLYDLYIAEGYSRSEAIFNIFQHNLTGIDLDTRAKQLATFALLLKACQKDASFAVAECMPNVLTMPKPWDEEKYGSIDNFLYSFFHDQLTKEGVEEMKEAFSLLRDADSLGSIMKFDLSDTTRLAIKQALEYWSNETLRSEVIVAYLPTMKLIVALTEKYHALVMNPPYMGSGNMNSVLSKYVKDNYAEGKADLFSVFMMLASRLLTDNGKYGMINMQSWMFLSSFENLRTRLLSSETIDSMLHLGPRTFDELSGEVVQNTAFVITKHQPTDNTCGAYYRLVEGKNCADKERMFMEAQQGNGTTIINSKLYIINYPNVPQNNFEKIPGMPLGYWLGEEAIRNFDNKNIGSQSYSSPGIRTGRDSIFIRDWTELSFNMIKLNGTSELSLFENKWFPITRGGERRLWYGNLNSVVLGENGFERVKNECPDYRLRESQYYFKEGLTWTMICSSKTSFRLCPKGILFGNGGPVLYPTVGNINVLMGFLNSKVAYSYINLLNPTINCTKSDIEKLPIHEVNNSVIDSLVTQNISLSKLDWDAHETSWDFQTNELLRIAKETDPIRASIEGEVVQQYYSLRMLTDAYKAHWKHNFMQLHANEEELNRQFISIYGLEDKLTPDVPLNEITILQQGEINVEGDTLKWNNDVIIKQLISYAVGCMLGRYRLDKPGLHIAHPNPTDEETAPYTVGGEQWEIDDDGIMPLMASDCGFSDNATVRFADFIRITMGADHLVENLNYAEQCLGKTLEQYFIKDFWKDHKKMYQSRPIYWLFASKKGTFQVIAYMHRMNAYTVERIRAKYLLPFIEHLEAEANKLDMRRAELSTKETKQMQQLQKQLDECREYNERLQVVAEKAISFDLDDGVVVNYAKFGDVVQKIK